MEENTNAVRTEDGYELAGISKGNGERKLKTPEGEFDRAAYIQDLTDKLSQCRDAVVAKYLKDLISEALKPPQMEQIEREKREFKRQLFEMILENQPDDVEKYYEFAMKLVNE